MNPCGRSVPSGRVGNAKDAVFRSNEHFREAVREQVCCAILTDLVVNVTWHA